MTDRQTTMTIAFTITIHSGNSMTNRYTRRLDGDDEMRRRELIDKIERALSQRSVAELEAISYDLFTKGYLED